MRHESSRISLQERISKGPQGEHEELFKQIIRLVVVRVFQESGSTEAASNLEHYAEDEIEECSDSFRGQ